MRIWISETISMVHSKCFEKLDEVDIGFYSERLMQVFVNLCTLIILIEIITEPYPLDYLRRDPGITTFLICILGTTEI